jgi:membrane associated rhomboid family serine protease
MHEMNHGFGGGCARRRQGVLLALIAFNAIIFGIQTMVPPAVDARLIAVFGLSTTGLESGAWWEFVSHAFLHGNLWHLLANMLGLWFAGRFVVDELGSRKFLLLYILSAIGGGLGQILLGRPGLDLIGASGAVFGVMLALTTMFANHQMLALLFFVIPVRLKAKYLGYGLLLAPAAMMLLGVFPWMGHAAHLGGAITGLLFARALGYPSAADDHAFQSRA